jgi:hypothetical protein
MEAHREIVANSGNAAARSRSASELIRLARELERLRTGGGVSAEDVRERLMAKVEATAERQADGLARVGLCPLCERPVSRVEAEALMARGADESQAGWLARIAWKPVAGGGAKT